MWLQSHIPHPHLPHLGRKAEGKAARASERSDDIVRSTYDKAADTASAAKHKTIDAAYSAKDKTVGAAYATKDKAASAAHAVQDRASSLTHSGKDAGKDASRRALGSSLPCCWGTCMLLLQGHGLHVAADAG